MRLSRNSLGTLAGITSLVLLWEVAAYSTVHLPDLEGIATAMYGAVQDKIVWRHFGVTAFRLFVGFVAGWLLGALLGAGMGFYLRTRDVFRPLMVVMLAIPSPVTAIAFTLLVGINEKVVAATLALSIMPFAAISIEAAIHAQDRKLAEMAEVYRLSLKQRLLELYLPQLLPYIASSVRTNFALAWKLLVAIEAIVSSVGIGAAMLFAFHLLNPELMVAYTLLFMLFIFFVDIIIIKPFEKLSNRWRI